MAKLIKAGGEEVPITPSNGASLTLEEIQRYVGGYFEAYRLPDGLWMLMDEDGKRKEKPINREASILLFGNRAGVVDFVVGDVIVGTQEEVGG